MTPRLNLLTLLAALFLGLSPIASAQGTEVSAPQPGPSKKEASPAPLDFKGAGITEDQIRAQLNGKLLFLRGFYLDNNLKFDEKGEVTGTPQKGSFTLCALDIKKVHLTKRSLELEGDRYGLHFFGALPYEDDSKPFDRVRLTGKKSKSVKITIDRELVVIPKVKKPKKGEAVLQAKAGAPGSTTNSTNLVPTAAKVQTGPQEASAADVKDSNGRTTTSSPAHSAKLLQGALTNIFADRIDQKMMASLPDYWQHYYQEKTNRKEFMPTNPAVLHVGGDVAAPRLLNGLEPGSNEFAQKNGIAGITLFRTVVDAQGKPVEIAIARPIGFGLDEKAIEAIRNSHFQPATKDGRAVPVVIDVVVTFRIYSNRTRGGQVAEPGIRPTQTAALPAVGVTPGNGR